MELSVIIVNYNTRQLLEQCLNSIVQNTHEIEYEVIVVDNNSQKDDSISFLTDNHSVRTVFLPQNIGFGRANNEALKYAEGEYILFLNSDTILLNNAFRLMLDYAKSYSGKLGAVGAVLEDKEGNKIHSYGHFPKMSDAWNKFLIIPVRKAMGLYSPKPDTYPEVSQKVDYVTGADLLVKRSVLDECGAFNPAFFMYYEETEMQLRFCHAGYDNVVINGPRIIHLEGGGKVADPSEQFLRDCLRQQRSEYIYYRLTELRWKYILYRIFYPLLRQTLWFNPRVSFAAKMTYMKQLFAL